MTLQQLRYIIAIEKNASFNKAAKSLYISQPSISTAVRDLEEELGVAIFKRTKKGITLTTDGQELLKYAYQMIDQEDALKRHFLNKREDSATFFSVSSLHFVFVVDLFAQLIPNISTNRYSLRLKETTTSMVIEDVARQRSEIGIIYTSEFSRGPINKILKENNLTFTPLVSALPHAFMHRNHPLSTHDYVTMEDLAPYPCVIFDQNNDMPLFFSEEIFMSNHNPPKILYVSDQSTDLKMQEKCNAYNIGSGLINAKDKRNFFNKNFTAVPILDKTLVTVGWISLSNAKFTTLGERFITLLQDYVKTQYGLESQSF